MIAKGCSEIFRIAKAHGMECRSLTWDPNYKGIDDWQLALRRNAREKSQVLEKERAAGVPTEAQCKTQRFRLYQLALDAQQQPIPFALRGIGALHKAGYTQPPASLYRLVRDTELPRREAQTDEDFLQAVRAHCRDGLPQSDGRPMAASDVVELYEPDERRYFYVDASGFVQTSFSPFLAKQKE